MKLLWVKYDKSPEPAEYYLIVGLGIDTKDNGCTYLIGLDEKRLSKNDIELIRRYNDSLDCLRADEVISWMKDRLDSFNKAYRSFHIGSVEVKNEYDIRSKGPSQLEDPKA